MSLDYFVFLFLTKCRNTDLIVAWVINHYAFLLNVLSVKTPYQCTVDYLFSGSKFIIIYIVERNVTVLINNTSPVILILQ